jgi:ABC-type antimicrobial peptide transport system permease subunit
LCALLLTALGLYGLLALGVTERTKEIGVRIALGAHIGQLIRHVVSEGLVLMAAGALVGLLGAVLLLRAMRALLFGVTPQDATTYAAGIAVLFIVALLASYIPARRVARVEPLTALRQD